MNKLGMNFTEGKALLSGVQDFVVAQQARWPVAAIARRAFRIIVPGTAIEFKKEALGKFH
jgi:hypothetical protein